MDLGVGSPLHLASKCTMVYKCGEEGKKCWVELLAILGRSLAAKIQHVRDFQSTSQERIVSHGDLSLLIHSEVIAHISSPLLQVTLIWKDV